MWRTAGFCTEPTKVVPLSLTTVFNSEISQYWFHIYADDIQLVISFNCIDPLEALPKLNSFISDIKVWMIKSNCKINDSETEFNVFRSPQPKHFCRLSISVKNSIISQSSKARDIGVIFDQSLSFDDNISGLCSNSPHFHLRNIGRIRAWLSYEVTAELLHTLITTRIDYSNLLLYHLPRSNIARL